MQSELEHGLHNKQFFLIWNMHLPERHTFIRKLSIAEIPFENEPGLETDSKADTTCESNSCFGTEKSNGSIVLEGLYLVETEAVEGSAALSLIQKCTVDV